MPCGLTGVFLNKIFLIFSYRISFESRNDNCLIIEVLFIIGFGCN